MASTYSKNLGIEKPATGEQAGSWGATANTNYDIIGEAINGILEGTTAVTIGSGTTSGSPYALVITKAVSADARNPYIEFTDAGGDPFSADSYVKLSETAADDLSQKIAWVYNNLSGSRNLVLFQGTYSSGRSYIIANGKRALVTFDGGGVSASNVNNVMTNLQIEGDFTATIATTVTVADESSDTSCFPLFVTAATGNLAPKSGSNLTFNSSTGLLTATQLGGTLQTAAQPNITSVGTLTGFTSTGIDDNATGERLQLADSVLNLGTSGVDYALLHTPDDRYFTISGGDTAIKGANIRMYGSTHATLADDFDFRGSNTTQLYYNDSASSWNFQANSLATTGAFSCAGFTSTGIDDNATSNHIQISDSGVAFGSSSGSGSGSIYSRGNGQTMQISGGGGTANGANLILFGGSNADANDFQFKAGATLELLYDDSASSWDFQANDIATTGAFSCAEFTSSGIDDNATATQVTITNNSVTLDDRVIFNNSQLTGQNVFYAGDDGVTRPALFFDTLDRFRYDRANTKYEMLIAGAVEYSFSNTTANFKANDITTTGIFTGNGSGLTNLPVGTGDLRADGTVPLTANWNMGAFDITCAGFTSTGIDDNATGTEVVISDTAVRLARTLFVGNDNLTLDDRFGLGAADADTPIISWDTGDSSGYTRTTNQYYFNIGSVAQFTLNATTADFQNNDVTTTGAFIGSAANTIVTGTSHTIVAADNGKVLVFTNAAAVAVTLPDGLAVGFHCTLVQTTASGVPTVTPSGSDTLNGAGSGVAPAEQWKGMYINKWDTGVWYGLI